MWARVGLGFLTLLVFATSAGGQDSEPSRLRVIQLSYAADIGAHVDVLIDQVVAFEAISFPFVTLFVDLEPGEHTLTTVLSGRTDLSAALPLTLEAGEDYSVIVEGNYLDEVAFTVIDESAFPQKMPGASPS